MFTLDYVSKTCLIQFWNNYIELTKQKTLQKSKLKSFEKYNNLSEDELHTKNNKIKTLMLEMMSRLLLLNVPGGRGEEVGGRRGERKIDAFRKKLIIPESETSECPEHKVKSNIRNIFVNEKILE